MKKGLRKLRIAAVVAVIIVGVLAAGLAIGLVTFAASDDYIALDLTKIRRATQGVTLTDAYGRPLEILYVNYVKLDELPKYAKNAFVAVEDARFYSHGGIDYKGVVRATVKNLSAGKFVEGGSTITQQLIKNTHLTGEKTFRRKANEFLLAYQLEKNLSKNDILEAYLNTAYFGNNCYGIADASGYYFGKRPQDLTLGESAMLAGILRSPNAYAPDKSLKKAGKRRDIALEQMLKNGFIDEKAMAAAKKEHITVKQISPNAYVKSALAEAAAILGINKNQLRRGYKIETYYDAETSTLLEKALASDKTGYGFTPQKLAYIIDNKTRGITAICGNVDNIFAVRRQAGSLMKPLAVYAPAIEIDAITVATPVLDEEINFGGYKPQNFGGTFAGWTTVSEALSKSLNIPALKTLNMIGVPAARGFLTANGIELSEKDDNLTLALGTVTEGVSPLALGNAYATLANYGEYRESGIVKAIWLDGKKIYEHAPRKNRVFSPETSYLTTYMLQNAAKNGTSRALKDIGFDVAAKTGTVGGKKNSDLYMCGYTSEQTFFVWIGGESKLDASLTAGQVCGDICLSYLNSLKKRPPDFPLPHGIELIKLDKESLEQRHILEKADYFTEKTITVPMKIKGLVSY